MRTDKLPRATGKTRAAKRKSGRAKASASEAANSHRIEPATTVRLKPETRRGLELLQDALGVTMNRLMNDALALFVSTRTAMLQSDLEASLARIKRYRKSHPGFSTDFEEIAKAEITHRGEDPFEGVPYRDAAGPAVSMVRRVIASKR
jgi:hypothetical protein